MRPLGEALGLTESVDMLFRLQHHLLCHDIDVGVWPIVHHRVGKHQVYIPLKLKRIRNCTFLYLRFDCLEIHGPLDNLMVIRGFGVFDWVMEDIAVTVIRYL